MRFDSHGYSVPVRRAHHLIVVKGGYQQAVLNAQGEEVGRHRRIWVAETVSFEPLHYLALLERKSGALDHVRPLQGWTLPESFAVFRRRLESQMEGQGTREYTRVLRLLEQHPIQRLRKAVERALEVGAITRDAIAQFLSPDANWRHSTFDLAEHPHLRLVQVMAPVLGEYRLLLAGGVQ